ncbi:DUF3429 domain-containing protein [Rhizobium sp. 'Codium 1']|uniref:DUF3429 domain-containing protein n=1 Tax=Rhizobium sp. 'Codium 1' TaxID=2940484 RepID=UPI001E3B0211|nr:DUF3429 domain-containing protein [Rhizobium sp. 'Codium 1']MCC8932688.1 DUF3429 domain-containing protein [Rhizobium sp. 'Codium 1']
MYRDPALTKLLTYAGALPFWALALAQVLGGDPALTAEAFIAYGTGIACFMAGTLWSQAQIRTQDPGLMLIVSNIAALAAIGGLLVYAHAPAVTMALHVTVFLVLLAADLRIHRKGAQPAWYLALRRNVTLLVIAAYAVVMILT